jgi:hypothetical protein
MFIRRVRPILGSRFKIKTENLPVTNQTRHLYHTLTHGQGCWLLVKVKDFHADNSVLYHDSGLGHKPPHSNRETTLIRGKG